MPKHRAGPAAPTERSAARNTRAARILGGVTQTDQDWNAGETIHTLENGARVVCCGPHIRYQRPA